MKKIILLLSTTLTLFANQTLWIDIDGDGKQDKIELIPQKSSSIIRCKLTAQNRVYKSKLFPLSIELLSFSKAKRGFFLKTSANREENTYQFRYEQKEKKIRLIGLESSSQTGNIQHSTSSISSVNLLTQKYVGDYDYFSLNTQEFAKLPTFYAKFPTKKIYLDSDILAFQKKVVKATEKYELKASKQYEKSSKSMAYFLKRKFPHFKVAKNLQDTIANKDMSILVLKKKNRVTVALVKSTNKGYRLMSKNHRILKNSNLNTLNIVKKGRYLSFEMNEHERERVITFRYNKKYKRWYLYKDGVVTNGKSRIKTKKDFGVVRFEKFRK